ncbi:MAG: DUF4124 domain-containing protein [Xanthomonadales bacterium]|nr:DUF4124 domain-containing protein [Xanthomonadales bacterium]
MIRIVVATTVALGLLASSAVSAAKLYKWVDENGNVHYSDQVPPSQAKQAREELNDQGVTVKQVDRALTADELAARRAEEKAAADAAAAIAAERERDRTLLDSYASEEDITRSYNQRVDLLDQTIEARKVEIGLREKNLADLVARAADTERSGRAVPEVLQKMIKDERTEIERQRGDIKKRESERVQAEKDYKVDIGRYREVAARYAKDAEADE